MYFHHEHVHPCFISHTLTHTCTEIRRRINPSGIISICLTHPVRAKLSQKCVRVDGGSAFWDDDEGNEGNEGRCSGRTDYLHGFLYKGWIFWLLWKTWRRHGEPHGLGAVLHFCRFSSCKRFHLMLTGLNSQCADKTKQKKYKRNDDDRDECGANESLVTRFLLYIVRLQGF